MHDSSCIFEIIQQAQMTYVPYPSKNCVRSVLRKI